jgi:selenocysteine lyase/cysteine desulfurase
MCVRLKEQMGISNMLEREEEILNIIFPGLSKMKNILVLEAHRSKRLGVISFLVSGAHYNLIVKLLNDKFGIQARGGCSCAGPYGHLLLNINQARSHEMLNSIRSGDLSVKPGWVRLSVHPTMTNADIRFILDAVEATVLNFKAWGKDYDYDPLTNEYSFKGKWIPKKVDPWFNPYSWKKSTPH